MLNIEISSASWSICACYLAGNADLIHKLWPNRHAPWVSELLDVPGVSDHPSSARERHMDRLQAVNQRQLRAGHAHDTIYTSNTSIDVEFTSHMLNSEVWHLT